MTDYTAEKPDSLNRLTPISGTIGRTQKKPGTADGQRRDATYSGREAERRELYERQDDERGARMTVSSRSATRPEHRLPR